jgi:hypothetical protein
VDTFFHNALILSLYASPTGQAGILPYHKKFEAQNYRIQDFRQNEFFRSCLGSIYHLLGSFFHESISKTAYSGLVRFVITFVLLPIEYSSDNFK